MEFEQLIKRLDWLEKEREKDKETVASLKEKVASLETSYGAATKQIRELDRQLTEATAFAARVEQFDSMLAKTRADISKMIADNDKLNQQRLQDAANVHLAQLTEINKSVEELKRSYDPTEIKRKLKERGDEIQRLTNNIADLKQLVDKSVQASQSVGLSIKAVEETRKNDLKRIADIQGEITAVRKRADETREKSVVAADGVRNIEVRVNELLAAEADRKQAQTLFLDHQSLLQVERDRAWKEWKEKYDAFQNEAAQLDSQVQSLDDAIRGAKKAQDTYVELNTKLERRISEVTEMQRLAEERLRQEWITFKADDQKRWTGYSLASEEAFRDIRKDAQKSELRVAALEEATQLLHDQLHQTASTAERQLQEIVNVAHEWATASERVMGHKKSKK
jgi:chromosome segregation ATPase